MAQEEKRRRRLNVLLFILCQTDGGGKKAQKQCQELKYREHDPAAAKNCSREDKEGATLKIIFMYLISRWRLVTNEGSNTLLL